MWCSVNIFTYFCIKLFDPVSSLIWTITQNILTFVFASFTSSDVVPTKRIEISNLLFIFLDIGRITIIPSNNIPILSVQYVNTFWFLYVPNSVAASHTASHPTCSIRADNYIVGCLLCILIHRMNFIFTSPGIYLHLIIK